MAAASAFSLRILAKTSVAVATANAVGDVGCQMITPGELDLSRTYRMSVTGLLLSGPWGHFQQHLSEYLLPGKSTKAIMGKIAIGGILAPISIGLTFTSLTLLQGKNLESAKQKVKQDVPSTWLAGLVYWPAVSGATFRYVPLQHRALAGSVAGILWGVIMSGQANREVTTTSTQPDAQQTLSPARALSTSSEPSNSLPHIALALRC
mmetsp:Transcript_30124/g.48653  ORF Transcript_30124/g.48653 Transcript_30124/m.48653 type:complete len:207 (-) Transcript_30124:157-777(-)|eukprot:CAMPEP_0184660636 /NCGR_PEP_ID=MMETSP0308-20130426/34521_1 /TAXON_ID=38269 /ORGANISM="Gloeochaete witrockiana, Strain SAG 46.84" /LENGTH=206 /DNA_ID=CAMNT_0027101341 /DNA_START=328 /DNA_END=948 /DNA_ORIENTATION=+